MCNPKELEWVRVVQSWCSKDATLDMMPWSWCHHWRGYKWGSHVPRTVSFTIEIQRWQLVVTWYKTGIISVGNLTLVYKFPDICVFTESLLWESWFFRLFPGPYSATVREMPPTSHAPWFQLGFCNEHGPGALLRSHAERQSRAYKWFWIVLD